MPGLRRRYCAILSRSMSRLPVMPPPSCRTNDWVKYSRCTLNGVTEGYFRTRPRDKFHNTLKRARTAGQTKLAPPSSMPGNMCECPSRSLHVAPPASTPGNLCECLSRPLRVGQCTTRQHALHIPTPERVTSAYDCEAAAGVASCLTGECPNGCKFW